MEGTVMIRKLLGKRDLVLGAFLLVCILFATQSFGIVQGAPAASDPAVAVEMDWALIGVLVAGALIILVRPRRRAGGPPRRPARPSPDP